MLAIYFDSPVHIFKIEVVGVSENNSEAYIFTRNGVIRTSVTDNSWLVPVIYALNNGIPIETNHPTYGALLTSTFRILNSVPPKVSSLQARAYVFPNVPKDVLAKVAAIKRVVEGVKIPPNIEPLASLIKQNMRTLVLGNQNIIIMFKAVTRELILSSPFGAITQNNLALSVPVDAVKAGAVRFADSISPYVRPDVYLTVVGVQEFVNRTGITNPRVSTTSVIGEYRGEPVILSTLSGQVGIPPRLVMTFGVSWQHPLGDVIDFLKGCAGHIRLPGNGVVVCGKAKYAVTIHPSGLVEKAPVMTAAAEYLGV